MAPSDVSANTSTSTGTGTDTNTSTSASTSTGSTIDPISLPHLCNVLVFLQNTNQNDHSLKGRLK